MDISPDILAKLLLLGQYKLSKEHFAILLQKIYFDLLNCFSSIITPDSAFTHKFLENELIEAHYTISMLILESAKNSIGKEALKCCLEDCLWPQNMIDTFLKFYSVNQFSQLKVMQHIQSNLPKLLDANWKLDYYVKNKDIEHVCDLCFQISLINESIGKTMLESLLFTCNFEELQDLVAKFRDAVKSIEKISYT